MLNGALLQEQKHTIRDDMIILLYEIPINIIISTHEGQVVSLLMYLS